MASGHLFEELIKRGFLGVDQGIHGVDQNGPNSLNLRIAQQIVNDWHHIGEAFAGSGARREDVGRFLAGNAEGLFLVIVEGIAIHVVREILGTVVMEQPFLHQRAEVGTGSVGRIELHQGIGPELPLIEFRLHKGVHPGIANFQKALDVGAVVLDNLIPQLEDIEGLGRGQIGLILWNHGIRERRRGVLVWHRSPPQAQIDGGEPLLREGFR